MRTRALGNDLSEVTLEDGETSVSILSLGAITRDWRLPRDGARVPVILGHQDPAHHVGDRTYMGAIAGRVANRIAEARFSLDGQTYQLTRNEGRNQLHGGETGLGGRLWTMEPDSAANRVRLTYTSPDGEEGYPGNVVFTVTISLNGAALTYDMTASTDRATPINLAQHNYYNLMGQGDILTHNMQCIADRFLPFAEDNLPTGDILPVAGGRYDFRDPATFGAMDPDRQGTDINLVFPEGRDPDAPVATITAPNGLRLRVWSDQPGAQLYTARHLTAEPPGLGGRRHGPFAGVCFEPQGFPDAVNHPGFPSIIVTPDRPYRQRLTVEISEVAR